MSIAVDSSSAPGSVNKSQSSDAVAKAQVPSSVQILSVAPINPKKTRQQPHLAAYFSKTFEGHNKNNGPSNPSFLGLDGPFARGKILIDSSSPS